MSFPVTHPKEIGDRSQLAVVLALKAIGYDVLMPVGENTRYDLVIDKDGTLSRVQCKTGRLRLGAVLFAVCSAYGHHQNPQTHRRTYEGQIDFFGVYCAATAGVYLVPIEDVPLRAQAALRVDPPRNNQFTGVRWARDYEIGTVAIGGLRAPSGA